MGTVRSRSQKPAKSASKDLNYDDLLREEAAQVIRHFMGKLPSGGEGDTAALLKEKLPRLIDKHYQDISSRLTAVQDGAAVGARQTSAGIAQTLRSMGGSDTFNLGEAEKPAGKKGLGDLEAHAHSLLRQKTGAGAFAGALSADTAIAIVKCRFRDNVIKPKTVTDVKLAVNITEPELVGPLFSGYAAAQYLIKNIICQRIIECIDRRIDNETDEKGVAALLSELDSAHFDLAAVRANIAQNGFSMALNALVAILDRAKLDYQCIENTRNGREVVIREYDDGDSANLPDERYALLMRYFDEEQLAQERAAYDAQLNSFERESQLLWDLVEVNYQDSKPIFKVNDFDDLAKKNKGRIRDLLKRKNGAPAQEIVKESVAVRFARMHERIANMYAFLYPVERRLMEDRLAWLERENARLDFMVNPHHLRPGLLIDVEATSIKRRKATLNSLAAALGEFLRGVYGCFQGAAFAVFGAEA